METVIMGETFRYIIATIFLIIGLQNYVFVGVKYATWVYLKKPELKHDDADFWLVATLWPLAIIIGGFAIAHDKWRERRH